MKYEYKIVSGLSHNEFCDLGRDGYYLKMKSEDSFIFERELVSNTVNDLNPLDVIVNSLNGAGTETHVEMLEDRSTVDFTLESTNMNTMVRMTFNKDGYLVGIENRTRLKMK